MKTEEKLIVLRKKNSLTQAELAGKINVTRQAISRWEVGTAVPTTENLKSLCKLYGVPLDYLLNEESLEPEEKISIPGAEETGIKKRCKRKIISILVVILCTLGILLFVWMTFFNQGTEDRDSMEAMQGEAVGSILQGEFSIE